jgi:uncharacterized membrane protein YbhN (UPF0104 family)
MADTCAAIGQLANDLWVDSQSTGRFIHSVARAKQLLFAFKREGNASHGASKGASTAAFLFSFSAALVSTAPAGLGVFELLFIKVMRDVPRHVIGSLMRFHPLMIGKMQIVYPRPEIMARQLFAAPMELVGAAGIIYFALPETGNPGFLVVLGALTTSGGAI